MTELFECSWKDKYDYYERVYNTNTQKSFTRKINLPFEWYEESSRGKYTYILDDSVKLERKQGSFKDGRDGYGFIDPLYRNIRDNYWSKSAYNIKPRTWYIDIETRVGTNSTGFPVPEKALEPITLIQIYDSKLNEMIVFGLREWKHQDDYKFDFKVHYIKCSDEIELMKNFLKMFKKLDPLIIYGWNTYNFDYPYIYNRLKNLGLDTNKLSNYGNTKLTESEFQGRKEFKFSSDGHYYMDLMVVYKTFVKAPRPTYSLDGISLVELKEKKVDHSEYVAFDDFYTGKYVIPKGPSEAQKNSKIYKEAIKGNWDEVKELAHSDFVYYGITDTMLVKRLDDKLNFTALMFMIADKMGILLSDTLGTVKPWSQYIMNKSKVDMKVTPPKREFDNPNVVGGYVRTPNKGKHNWILSTDVNSMYPLLGMMGFNMSPETYVSKANLPQELREIVLRFFNNQNEDERFDITEKEWNYIKSVLKKHNMCLGINGAVFTKDKLGMIPEMVDEIYTSRKQAKKTMFKYEKQKVLIKDILSKRT